MSWLNAGRNKIRTATVFEIAAWNRDTYTAGGAGAAVAVVAAGARGAGAGRHVGYVEGWVGWNVFGYVADY